MRELRFWHSFRYASDIKDDMYCALGPERANDSLIAVYPLEADISDYAGSNLNGKVSVQQ
jgi:hypothetical protein